jgi:hypothetical protein
MQLRSALKRINLWARRKFKRLRHQTKRAGHINPELLRGIAPGGAKGTEPLRPNPELLAIARLLDVDDVNVWTKLPPRSGRTRRPYTSRLAERRARTLTERRAPTLKPAPVRAPAPKKKARARTLKPAPVRAPAPKNRSSKTPFFAEGEAETARSATPLFAMALMVVLVAVAVAAVEPAELEMALAGQDARAAN